MHWINCNDLLPDTNRDVLCFDGQNRWVANYFNEKPNEIWPNGRVYWSFKTDNDNCCDCVCPELDVVTHWAELPENPK